VNGNGDGKPVIEPVPRRWGWAWACAGLALATLAGVAIGLTDRASRPPDRAPLIAMSDGPAAVVSIGTRIAVGCAHEGTDRAAAQAYCERVVADFATRVPLTTAQSAAARARLRDLDSALFLAACGQPDVQQCIAQQARGRLSSPEPLDAVRIADALRSAGFINVVVRTARFDDPAEPGSVVYGAGVDEACIVGWLRPDGEPASSVVEGQRPDGYCLAP
jgi:hypothetical protein